MLLNFFLHADIPGRCNIASLSQQTLMELLVANVSDSEAFKDASGDFLDIYDWKGVKLNENDEVISIDWEIDFLASIFEGDYQPALMMGGDIDFQFLPSTLKEFNIDGVSLSGTVNTHSLPRGLTEFMVSENRLHGGIDTAGLPAPLKLFYIEKNLFSGSFAFANLPGNIDIIDISHNDFSGSISLSGIRAPIRQLLANDNAFCGSLSLENMPKTLEVLYLEKNKFKQDVLLVSGMKLPEFPGGPGYTIQLDENAFGRILHAKGREISVIPSSDKQIVRIQDNGKEPTGKL